MENKTALASTVCMTYNQAPYIKQCLDGFVMQQTKFPFVAIVVDDASTDNELVARVRCLSCVTAPPLSPVLSYCVSSYIWAKDYRRNQHSR